MKSNSHKIVEWDGIHKTRCRLLKLHEVTKYLRAEKKYGPMDEHYEPACLTFAGCSAKFERMLVNGNITSPDRIFTIQTYQRLGQHHFGKELLDKLIKTRQKYLPEMNIWPHNFHSFSRCFTLEGCKKPSDSTQALWNTAPYKQLLNGVIEAAPTKFSILDLDFCGIFNKRNSDSVVNLFSNKLLEDSGVAFINHQKGRDVRGGELFKILHRYLMNTPLVDFSSIPNIMETGDGWPTYVARYVLIPMYYMCKAREHGYILTLERLSEYRDSPKNSNGAVNMLQFYFKWYKAEALTDPDFVLRENLEEVMDEDYKYHQWIQ